MLRNLILFCALFIGVNVVAQTKAELEKKKNETLKEIESLNKQYDNIKKTKKESLGQLALIQQKINLRNQVIGDINKQVAFINKDIDSSNDKIKKRPG